MLIKRATEMMLEGRKIESKAKIFSVRKLDSAVGGLSKPMYVKRITDRSLRKRSPQPLSDFFFLKKNSHIKDIRIKFRMFSKSFEKN